VIIAALSGAEGVNPSLALNVQAQATLYRVRDGVEMYRCPIKYRSKGFQFTEWAANDARLFRREMRACYEQMSQAVVDQLVLRGMVQPGQLPQEVFASK